MLELTVYDEDFATPDDHLLCTLFDIAKLPIEKTVLLYFKPSSTVSSVRSVCVRCGRRGCRGHRFWSFQALSMNCNVSVSCPMYCTALSYFHVSGKVYWNASLWYLPWRSHFWLQLLDYQKLALVGTPIMVSMFYFLELNSGTASPIIFFFKSCVTPIGLKYSNQDTSGELQNNSKNLEWDF